MQSILGSEYDVINEGMCDRTGFIDNPNGFLFSGAKHFPEFISETKNVDILILWIGTNDLMFKYNITESEIEKGLENLIKSAQTKTKNIVIIPPVILSEKILEGYFGDRFNETSIKKSREIGRIFKTLAKIHHCSFFDVNNFVTPSLVDGLHYDENSHKIIAGQLAKLIKNEFQP